MSSIMKKLWLLFLINDNFFFLLKIFVVPLLIGEVELTKLKLSGPVTFSGNRRERIVESPILY